MVKRKLTDRPICGKDSILSRHLENRGVKKRKEIKPKAELLDIQRIQPEGDRHYTAGRILEFTFQTGSYAVRLLQHCLQVQLSCLVKNNRYVGPNEDTAERKLKWYGMTPFHTGTGQHADQKYTNRALFYNPISGGASCLISEIEVYIDNQLVQAVRDGFLSITNTLNKLFLPADKRQEILGHSYILHNEGNGVKSNLKGKRNADLDQYDPSYRFALKSVDMINKQKPKRVLISSDLDGVLFCGKPKNLTLEQIYGCASAGENQNALIPPFTNITFRMRLADPLHLRAIDNGISDDDFFSSEVANDPTTDDDKFPTDDVLFKIEDIALIIEKIKWDNDKIHRQLSSGSISYNWDQYIYRATALQSGVVRTTTKDHLPANTELVYFVIMKSNQLYKDSSKKRSSDGTRFAIPERLQEIIIRLNNKVILFEEGLKISRNNCNSEVDAGLFYHYLVKRDLTTDSFESFFPQSGLIGYKNAFPLDLSPYKLTEPSQLSIECVWEGAGCPTDLYLCLFIPQSVTVVRDSATSAIWKSNASLS